MATADSPLFRTTSKFVAASVLLSSCATAVEAAGAKIRMAALAAYGVATWETYPETQVRVFRNRGQVGGPVSADGSVWHGDSVAARDDAIAKLNDPTWNRPSVEPVLGTSSTPADPGDNSIWSTDPTPSSAGNHMAGVAPGSGNSGGGAADPSASALGEPLAWQDSFPAGGTLLSPGQVNSLSGDRLATVPIVSYEAKGGIGIDLTLYHNSSGSAGYLWGRGWRSSYDVEVVQGTPATNPRRATIVFGDGSAIPFVARSAEPANAQAGTGEMLYSPPVGYYDVLTRFGDSTGSGGWYLRRRDGSLLTFNRYGRLASIRDRRNNTVTIGRANDNSPMTSVTDAAGRQLVFTLSSVPNSSYQAYSKVVDPAGREWKFQVEAQAGGGANVVGDLRSVTLPKVERANAAEVATKLEWTYAASTAPQILAEKDPLGNVWTYTYETGTGRLKTAKDPLNKTTTYATGSTATMTTPLGAVYTHAYAGDVISSKTDPAGYNEYYHYDLRRNRDEYIDRRGKTWRSVYDAYGNRTSLQSPEQYKIGKSESFVYGMDNVMTSRLSARGATTTITPDLNDAKKIVDGDGKTVYDSVYDAAGQPTSVSDAGVGSTPVYDAMGRIASIATANGTTTLTYASTGMGRLGFPSSATLPGRGTRGVSYDDRGRVTASSVGAPQEMSFKLDALGRPVEIWTHDGKRTLEYDALSRVKKITNPRLDVEQYTYNDDGYLTDVARGNGTSVHYTVEPRGDVSSEWDMVGGWPGSQSVVTQYSYDGEGNILRVAPPSGTTTNAYDDDGNLKTVTHPDNFVESYLYDEDGNRTRMVDRTGTTNWTYTPGGRQLTMSAPGGNVAYGYDAYGAPRTVAHAAPGTTPGAQNTITTNRSYPDGRVTWYGNGYTNMLANYTYDSFGRLLTRSTPSGLSTTYTYDAWGRESSIVHKNSTGGVIRSESYTYEGTRVKTRTVGSTTTTYGYDLAGQLQSESRTGYSANYTYDRNGNRLTRNVNGVVDTYSYTGNRLDAINRSGGLSKTYAYDAANRPTSIKGWDNVVRNLTWNDEDKLTSAPGVLAGTQAYNGDGARVVRNGVPHRRADSNVTSPVLDDGPNRALVPGVGERNGTSNFYLLPDRVGTNALTIEPSGQTVPPAVETDAFGTPLQSPGQRSRWNWKGGFGYYDEDGGAYLVGHRWYDADAGRFLTRDPARDGRNWWAYSGNDPVNQVDPEGLNLTVIGDTGGVERWSWLPEGPLGVGGKKMRQPTRKQLIEALINEKEGSEVMIWGHGGPGYINLGNGESLSTADIQWIAKERKRLGKGKLGKVTLRACNTCESAAWVNAWLSISGELNGYCSITTDGPMQSWDKPVMKDPRRRNWLPWTSDKKQDKKEEKEQKKEAKQQRATRA